MAKLKIKNEGPALAFVQYKGLKDGGKTFVDLKSSVAQTKTFESPIDVPPGSDVKVKIGNLQKSAKANTNKILLIKSGLKPADWKLTY